MDGFETLKNWGTGTKVRVASGAFQESNWTLGLISPLKSAARSIQLVNSKGEEHKIELPDDAQINVLGKGTPQEGEMVEVLFSGRSYMIKKLR